MENQSEKKAGVFALIVSFLIPIVGVVIYFIKRKEVENASAYLIAAGGGFVFGLILGSLG